MTLDEELEQECRGTSARDGLLLYAYVLLIESSEAFCRMTYEQRRQFIKQNILSELSGVDCLKTAIEQRCQSGFSKLENWRQ